MLPHAPQFVTEISRSAQYQLHSEESRHMERPSSLASLVDDAWGKG